MSVQQKINFHLRRFNDYWRFRNGVVHLVFHTSVKLWQHNLYFLSAVNFILAFIYLFSPIRFGSWVESEVVQVIVHVYWFIRIRNENHS
jgi:hypothetical protein